MSRTSQQGYVLYTVVIMLVVVAATALLVRYDSSFKASVPVRVLEATNADYVAQAAMQHAVWQKDNYACAGDFTIPATDFGPHSYTATIGAAATTANNTFNPDRDAWIKEAAPNDNFGGESELPVKNKPTDSFRALYHYDLSSIATGSIVQSATAWFYVTANDDQGAIEIHAVTANWTEPRGELEQHRLELRHNCNGQYPGAGDQRRLGSHRHDGARAAVGERRGQQ